MNNFDIQMTYEQFFSLSQFQTTSNNLSPFAQPPLGLKTGRLTNTEIVHPDGNLKSGFQPIMDVISSPSKVVAYKMIKENEILDLTWYFPNDINALPLVLITNKGDEIRLQAAAPVDESLFIAQSLLAESSKKVPGISWNLDITESFLFWIFIDENKNGIKAIKLDELQSAIKTHFSGMSSLAGYYRESMNLLTPSKSEIEKATFRLVQKGFINPSKEGFTPGENLAFIATDLQNATTYLQFKTICLDEKGEICSSRFWGVQAKSGAVMLWFEVEGLVTLHLITPPLLIELLASFLVQEKTSPPAGETNIQVIPPTAHIPQPADVIRYQPPRKKGSAGQVLLSLFLGIVGLVASLFIAGFLIFSPGKGVAFNPSGEQTIISPEGTKVSNTASPLSPTVPTPSASDLQIDMVNAVMVSDEQWMVMGRITNIGAIPISSSEIAVELMDASGVILESGSAHPFSAEIAPGEVSFFNYYYYFPTAVSSVTTTVSDVYSDGLQSSHSLISVEKPHLHGTPGYAELIGELVNRTEEPLQVISTFGILLDVNGQIIGVEKGYEFIIALRPGENMPVKISIPITIETAATVDSFQIVAEAYPVTEVKDSPISVSRDQNLFRTENGVVMAGEVMNTSDQAVQFSGLIGALYDSSGDLMDVSFTNTEIGLLPGGTVPYLLYGWNYLKLEDNKDLFPSSYLILAARTTAYPLEKPLKELDVVINSNQTSGSWYEVTGTVLNNSGVTTEYGAVNLSLRDPQTNKVITSESSWFGELAPGISREFNVFMVFPEGVDPQQLLLEYYASATEK
jgi:hypothetical protein